MSEMDVEAVIDEKVRGLIEGDQTTAADGGEPPESGEATPEEGTIAPEPEPWADQFGPNATIEDVWRAYENSRQLQGRMGQELGDLRKAVEGISQSQSQQGTGQPNADMMRAAADLIDEDPQAVALWAVQQNQPLIYERAVRALADEDIVAAQRVERFAERHQQAMLAQQQASQVEHERQGFVSTWERIEQRHPDLAQHAPAMLQIAQASPQLGYMLTSGRPEDQEGLIEVLYLAARGGQSVIAGPGPAVPAQPAQPAPHVVSAGAAPVREGQPTDVVRRAIWDWAQSEPSIEAGLTRP